MLLLIQWILLSLAILFALAADRAWNQGYKFSAFLAGFMFSGNLILWGYSLFYDLETVLQNF